MKTLESTKTLDIDFVKGIIKKTFGDAPDSDTIVTFRAFADDCWGSRYNGEPLRGWTASEILGDTWEITEPWKRFRKWVLGQSRA